MDDNKRLTMEVSRMHDDTRNFDNSMIQATVGNEKKLQKANSRNSKLMLELASCKKKIKELER